jgi:hypothetical protein
MSAWPTDASRYDAGQFHPEFGYFAPTMRFWSKAWLGLKGVALGALAGAVAVFFLTKEREEKALAMLATPVTVAPRPNRSKCSRPKRGRPKRGRPKRGRPKRGRPKPSSRLKRRRRKRSRAKPHRSRHHRPKPHRPKPHRPKPHRPRPHRPRLPRPMYGGRCVSFRNRWRCRRPPQKLPGLRRRCGRPLPRPHHRGLHRKRLRRSVRRRPPARSPLRRPSLHLRRLLHRLPRRKLRPRPKPHPLPRRSPSPRRRSCVSRLRPSRSRARLSPGRLACRFSASAGNANSACHQRTSTAEGLRRHRARVL